MTRASCRRCAPRSRSCSTPAGDRGATAYSPEFRPIHLTLTTTLLTADARTVTDALGAAVSQPSHTGRFRFLRTPSSLGTTDHFAPPVGDLADRLALAARCTASFPVAFEPVRVTVTPPPSAAVTGGGVGKSSPPRQTAALGDPSPDMSAHANFSTSRWVVDGGVLMNTPLRPVLDAIQAAPAGIQVRRALLLVVPDPYVASAEELSPDETARPTVARTLGRIVQSVESQTVAEELRMIEEHNMRAQARRDSRTDMLRTVTSGSGSVADDLTSLASTLFRNYRDIRIWRASSAIAAQTAPILGEPAAALAHQIRGGLRDSDDQQRHLPWVPDSFAQGLVGGVVAATGPFRAPGAAEPADWEWGLATLERLAVAVQDLLKRAVWVMGPGPARTPLMELRERHSQALGSLMTLRRADTAYWQDRARRLRAAQPEGPLPQELLVAALASGLAEWRTGLADFLTGPIGGPGRRPSVSSVPPMADLARILIDIGHEAVGYIPDDIDDPDGLLQYDRLQILRRVFEPDDPDHLMRAVLGLEVCYLCLVETDDFTASEQVIELVRISAGVDQPFAPGLPAQQRVAGLRMGHFAAFLKQAWRVNDWTWGRLDAANRLVALLLDPARLRRRVLLSGADSGPGAGVSRKRLAHGPTPPDHHPRRGAGTAVGAGPGPARRRDPADPRPRGARPPRRPPARGARRADRGGGGAGPLCRRPRRRAGRRERAQRRVPLAEQALPRGPPSTGTPDRFGPARARKEACDDRHPRIVAAA